MIILLIATTIWLGIELEDNEVSKQENRECLKILRYAESNVTEYQYQNVVAKYKQCLVER